MQKILVPLDGSQAAHKALTVACDLARANDAALYLVHLLLRDKEPEELHRVAELEGASESLQSAIDQAQAAPARELAAEEIMADRHAVVRAVPDEILTAIGDCILEVGGKEADARGVKAVSLGLQDGPTAEGILACAADQGVDTIVMGRRGLRNIEAIALGSVSQAVGEAAPCTCITVM